VINTHGGSVTIVPEQPEADSTRPQPAQHADAAPSDGSVTGHRSAWPWLVAGVVLLVLGGILLKRDAADRQPVPNTDVNALGSATTGSIGGPARFDLTLKDLNGANVSLATFKGKIVVVNFWATWCGPCRAEIPDLVELQEQYREDLVILGFLALDPIGPHTQPFVTEFKINYQVLDANDRDDVEQAYGPIGGLPTSVIIGRDGRVAQRFLGARSKEQFERVIDKLR
jgi:thiol-disulfide isomerase/thioredoxin